MPLPYRYEQTSTGDLPLKIDDVKKYLKIDGSTDNAVIQNMIATTVQWGERYTGRDFRTKTWKLFLDCFEDRIILRKSSIVSLTSVKYTLADTLTTIASTVYQFKKGHQWSELLIRFDQSWPSDGDEIEAGIEVIFVTEIPRYIESYKIATLKHIAYLYENRGDCDASEAAMKSGAIQAYGGRIERI